MSDADIDIFLKGGCVEGGEMCEGQGARICVKGFSSCVKGPALRPWRRRPV